MIIQVTATLLYNKEVNGLSGREHLERDNLKPSILKWKQPKKFELWNDKNAAALRYFATTNEFEEFLQKRSELIYGCEAARQSLEKLYFRI